MSNGWQITDADGNRLELYANGPGFTMNALTGERIEFPTNVSIHEQASGDFRVQRDDGQPIFGQPHRDFPSEDDAVLAVLGEFRRKNLPVRVRVQRATE